MQFDAGGILQLRREYIRKSHPTAELVVREYALPHAGTGSSQKGVQWD